MSMQRVQSRNTINFLMNFINSTSSFLSLKPSSQPPRLITPNHHTLSCCPNTTIVFSHPTKFPVISHNPSHAIRSSVCATIPSNEGAVSEVRFEDFVEKDWSFLDIDAEHIEKIDRIISAGEIVESSKVLVSIGSEAFVDRVVYSSPCEQLLIVHDSLFVLACIKEKYDNVKCWQGELINVPEKWAGFNVVFLYFLPALPFELDQVLAAIAERCLPGARIVISHPHGRKTVEEQRDQYPDVVVSDLPEKINLQKIAEERSFEVVEFVDEPGFYLAVLRFNVK
ncbi:hypothetical protein ACJIZ3_025772 [Penstemon smallii]|uniref:Uncharacterized protein n=1 Tax=Penstemon smallii TaxID=265156 RepID=A0ABD3TWV4_9LAMI